MGVSRAVVERRERGRFVRECYHGIGKSIGNRLIEEYLAKMMNTGGGGTESGMVIITGAVITRRIRVKRFERLWRTWSAIW